MQNEIVRLLVLCRPFLIFYSSFLFYLFDTGSTCCVRSLQKKEKKGDATAIHGRALLHVLCVDQNKTTNTSKKSLSVSLSTANNKKNKMGTKQIGISSRCQLGWLFSFKRRTGSGCFLSVPAISHTTLPSNIKRNRPINRWQSRNC